MPQLFDTWVGDSGTRSDGHEYCKETDPNEGLDEEVLVQEEEGDDKEADVDDVVRDVDLDPCDDRDDVTDPHEPTGRDTLRIDEEAEAYGVEEYTHQHDQEVLPEVLGDRLMREFVEEILELLAEERQQIEILCHCYLLVRLVEVKLL